MSAERRPPRGRLHRLGRSVGGGAVVRLRVLVPEPAQLFVEAVLGLFGRSAIGCWGHRPQRIALGGPAVPAVYEGRVRVTGPTFTVNGFRHPDETTTTETVLSGCVTMTLLKLLHALGNRLVLTSLQ